MDDFKQLRIRAYLQTPVVSDEWFPLDGVLWYHFVRRELGEEIVTTPGQSSMQEGSGLTLPIKKGGRKDETWFYHISAAQWPDHAIEASSFKVKQGDWLQHTDYLDDKVNRVDNKRGKFKAGHIKFYYHHALYVDWYCVGVPERLIELLRFCTHIGKNTGDGWGAVLRWEVKEWPEDWSIRGFNNKLMRPVPLPDQDGKGHHYGLRPSYWNPRHIFVCKMPDKPKFNQIKDAT